MTLQLAVHLSSNTDEFRELQATSDSMLPCVCAGGTAGLVCPHTATGRMAAGSIIAGWVCCRPMSNPQVRSAAGRCRPVVRSCALAACTAQVRGRALPALLQTAPSACSRAQHQSGSAGSACFTATGQSPKLLRGLCTHGHAPAHNPQGPEGPPTPQSATALSRGCWPAAQQRAAPCQQRWLPAQE